MFYYEWKYVFILFYFLYANAIELVKKDSDLSASENGKWNPITQIMASGSNDNQMNSTLYMSVNKYYCMVDEIEDPFLILYGTKSWTFPIQDVNLTLSYPAANSESEFSGEDEGYLITGFKVVLYIDGIETKGYITSGGVLKDSIVLTFLMRDINSLSYQFWLYGMPKNRSGIYTELLNMYYMCQ